MLLYLGNYATSAYSKYVKYIYTALDPQIMLPQFVPFFKNALFWAQHLSYLYNPWCNGLYFEQWSYKLPINSTMFLGGIVWGYGVLYLQFDVPLIMIEKYMFFCGTNCKASNKILKCNTNHSKTTWRPIYNILCTSVLEHCVFV